MRQKIRRILRAALPGQNPSPYAIGISILLLFLVIAIAWDDSRSATVPAVREETIVVSASSDPYFSLAQRIAQEEHLRIVEAFADILAFHPTFVILVASPENLSAEKLADIGDTSESQGYYPAVGIISGSTLDTAKQLWERRDSAQRGSTFVGGDVDPLQLVYEPTLFDISNGASTRTVLDTSSLSEALKRADYMYWTRHSGGRTWYWNDGSENWSEQDELTSQEIPQLKPVVIYSPSCSAFRPWLKDSIALGFIDKGAAAFVGFINSPHSASFSKYGLAVPGLTSWKEFPLGVVAQVQNKAARRIIYASPQLFMFGDPRVYLSKDQPYHVIADQTDENGTRSIEGYSDTDWMLAIKVDNAVDYDFLSIKGLTSISERDTFYNSKAQSLNLGPDKYILMLHKGGRFQIELSHAAPFGWTLADTFVDALDYSWVVLWVNVYADANPYIYVLSIFIFVGILLFKAIKQKRSPREYQKIYAIAFLIATFRLAYYMLRLNEYTVSTNLIDYTAVDLAVGFLGVFSGVAGGLIVMRDSQNIVITASGLLFTVARQFWMVGFYLGFITLLNNLPQVTKMTEAGVLNYAVGWLACIALLIEILIISSVNLYTGKK